MTPDRFETLAEAWGGEVARWPAAEREAAATLMAEQPAWASAILARAGDLDAALDVFAAPRASGALAERIVAGAPKPRAARWVGWLIPVGMGAGLAAACAAGVLVGAQVSAPAAGAASDTDALVTAVSADDFSLYDEDA
ncbi:MAG: hypothetical protein JNL41_10285 [Phenylobacterium sp.]|uniref:hypothetical protein n=1 Tax=Phenylobacterium sp. TaxID=1871053 RepID=UPI001A5CFE2C|nr:hypothetical protein [Phenylobacterium sp.]MBL8554654.1 hypothetical protein [Phenylobacterium sp.]